MLRELHIHNLAVIDEASITFEDGLNCFTGQTGAGKSLILGSFEILLGIRSGGLGEMIRPGCEEARVSGVFELHDPAVVATVAQLLDVALKPGEQLLITRRIQASGRSSFHINAMPATAAMVRSVGELLVDVHGQHDHQLLLRPSHQLQIIDRFAEAEDLRHRYASLHAQLRSLSHRRAELADSSRLRTQQLELYSFQAQEIDAADPTPGEFPELQARHRMLSHLRRLKREAAQAHAALYEAEGSVVERLQMISHVMQDLAELDDHDLPPIAEQVKSATLSLQEAAFDLGRYLDALDVDPGEVEEVEARLNVLNRLISKYGSTAPGEADPLEPVLAYRDQIETEIQQLRADNADLGSMDQQIAMLEANLRQVGQSLRDARQAAIERLCPRVDAQLAELGMAEAVFTVSMLPTDDAASGLDAVEMMVRTNPGQPARPLRKIASGGEMSRIMLAIESILADSDRTSVLVFDEIDANIGGRLGTVIGQKLRDLTRSRPGGTHHQVLCITHLPQIAAFADHHLRIAKLVEGKGRTRQTRTVVEVVEGTSRIDELAEMLAGKQATGTTRKQARELLGTAAGT